LLLETVKTGTNSISERQIGFVIDDTAVILVWFIM